MKLLITGANGQVGQCLLDRATGFDVVAYSRDELDIINFEQVAQEVNRVMPDFIINCAAYTAVDKAESEPELAHAINCNGAANLALAAKNLNIPIIHISTDYVFDGNEEYPYLVTDKACPKNVYGESKRAGEEAVIAANEKHIIIRTAWVFSEYGNNFVKTMLRLAKDRNELGIVSDQFGCPTYAGDLSNFILEICIKIKLDNFYKYGVYHFTGDEKVSWFEFSEQIFEHAYSINLIDKAPLLKTITTNDYPTPAERPKFSVLDCNSSTLSFPNINRCWKSSLSEVLTTLHEEA